MNYRPLAFLVLASALTLARAQDEERQQRPQTEIPDFSNLDEYIYEPKSTVHLSFRHLSGAKTQFSGTGSILAPEVDLVIDPNVAKVYHDGTVGADQRTTPRLDQGGNPFTDPQTGVQQGDPVPNDGRTNNWNYTDQRQVDQAPLGYIAFHRFSAEVTDPTTQHGKSRSTNGLDLAVSHDMGKLFNGRFNWNVVAGMSINDISARRTAAVQARVTTRTDYYSTFGQGVPTAPYSAPSTTTQPYTDSSGNLQSLVIDNSVLIGNTPALSTTTTAVDVKSTVNTWKLKGAYYTFRAGPELEFPFTTRFRLSMSAGLALVYAGTNYTVTESFTPEIGEVITETDTEDVNKLLPGFYADASLEFDLTEKAGFFAGGIFQSAKGYTQSLNSTTSKYVSKIDLSNQSGFRAGMSIRF